MPAADPLDDLGVTLREDGGGIRVWSASATAMELLVFDPRDADRVAATVPLTREHGEVWAGSSPALVPGARYALRADGPDGPSDAFDPEATLLDPYARAVVRSERGGWRGVVVDGGFDWGASERPRIPLDHTVVYEAHAKGLTKRHPGIPEELRGTYAGLAHPAMIEHLRTLGVTAVELLPIHRSISERRLQRMGLTNYWGYNTLAFFAAHDPYASAAARREGPDAVLRELKGAVRLLHEAGIEVILDVVYNHTAEEGRDGPVLSFRGLDDAHYYRHDATGAYVDTTGCGNTLDASRPVVQRLILDSLRYWADEVRVDGFRFDLMATLGRDAAGAFDPAHPLLAAILADPSLRDLKLIAEPWDVGPGGWQTGAFPLGYLEWNDGYRDRARQFWLRDAAHERMSGSAGEGIGPLAQRVSGSDHVFTPERGPLASIDFVTAHDGFTAVDLVSYDRKHNDANGENGRDGTDDNRSWNHGWEGPTRDPQIAAERRRTLRTLLGTLLFSVGVPMLTAGDEFGRSQNGNNNPYCQDSELTWIDWELDEWQRNTLEITRALTRLRRENPALRPVRFGRGDETVKSANRMAWFGRTGEPMTAHDWDSPDERTVQYLGTSTPELEQPSRVLIVVHGRDAAVEVTLPEHDGVIGYVRLWDSGDELPGEPGPVLVPGTVVETGPRSLALYRAV